MKLGMICHLFLFMCEFFGFFLNVETSLAFVFAGARVMWVLSFQIIASAITKLEATLVPRRNGNILWFEIGIINWRPPDNGCFLVKVS